MLGVWYPFDLLKPGGGIPGWVLVLVAVAFLLGCAFAIWLFRRR